MVSTAHNAQIGRFYLRMPAAGTAPVVPRSPAGAPASRKAAAVPVQPQRRQFEISANDRRFLRSLRIAAEETQEKEVE